MQGPTKEHLIPAVKEFIEKVDFTAGTNDRSIRPTAFGSLISANLAVALQAMLKFTVITIFPQMLDSPLGHSILKKAQEKGLIKIRYRRSARLHHATAIT